MPQLNFTVPDELLDRIDAAKPSYLDRKGFLCLLLDQALDRVPNLPACRAGAGTQQGNSQTECIPNLPPQLPSSEADFSAFGLNTPSQQDSQDFRLLAVHSQTLEPKKKGRKTANAATGLTDADPDHLVAELLVTPRERGTNPCALGTNPRALGTNPRALGTNPRAQRDPFSRRSLSPDLVPDDLADCRELLPEFWSVKKGTRSQRVWNRICTKLREWSPETRRLALERAITSGWADIYEPPASALPTTAKPSSEPYYYRPFTDEQQRDLLGIPADQPLPSSFATHTSP